MEKWITFSDLCTRWNINKHNLAHVFLSGEIMAYHPLDFSCIFKMSREFVREPPNNEGMCGIGHPTVDEVATYIFDINEVMDYEREKGITPNVLPTNMSMPIFTENLFDVYAPKGLPNKKPITNSRRAIALAEAAKLRRDNPEIDRVKAKKQVDFILKSTVFEGKPLIPYSRSQFNRLIEYLDFPHGKKGRLPTNKKK